VLLAVVFQVVVHAGGAIIGIAAFGVGPLRQLAGWSFSTVFAAGSIVALAFALVATRLARQRPRPGFTPR